MKIKLNTLLIIMGFIVAIYSIPVLAQNNSDVSRTTIESIVVDENGNPISGALVRGDEGAIITRTDNLGRFSISVPQDSELFIECKGYEPTVLMPSEYSDKAQLQLSKSPLLMGLRDSINTAFDKVDKKKIVNAISVITPNEIREYDNIESISQVLSGRVLGMYGGNNIRGIGEPLYVVDGLPRSIDNLNLSEIEQITVLKDINSAILYGAQAQNGVVLITTKRGEAFKKDIKVTGYYGINTPLALPKYLSSAEYMQLNNEARINDGLAPLYNEEMINNFQAGNPYRYPNVDYYSSDYIKKIKPFWKTMLELSGGNDKARYYVNAGWEHSGSYLNFGEGKKANQNKFNVRGNVDMILNSWITTALDASAFFINTRNPRGGFWGEAATTHPHTNVPLIPISMIDPENEILLGRKNDVDGLYLLGGSSAYLTNAIAHSYAAGYVERSHRTFSFNNRINFNLDRVLSGLSFHTNISFDFYSVYDQAIQNEYSVYEPVWDDFEEKIIDLKKYGDDVRPGVHYAGNSQYERRLGFYGMFDYKKTFNDDHEINANLLGFSNTYNVIGDYQGVKNYTAGLRINYTYAQKYMMDFSSTYIMSNKLAAGHRGAYSPSLGLAWLISSEDFMKSASAVDHLKLRLSAGILNTDVNINGFFLHANRYGTSGSYDWYDSGYRRYGTIGMQGGNVNLGFEKFKDINFGFDGQFFNGQLLAVGNIFYKDNYDIVARPQTVYPSFYTQFIPWENFGEQTYKGFELGLSYRKNIRDFNFEIGANLLYTDSEIKIRDEIYDEPYRYRAGNTVDGRWGLVADGFFMDQADIESHSSQSFGEVRPGDIKYIDQNNDGVIDENDEVLIGRWQAPWSYGLSVKLSYSNFTFFVHGTGRYGADGEISNDYYRIDGNDKYSEYALRRWTEETKHTASMPRLTSQSNSNNNRSSTFWLYKDNYFTFDRVQLTYTIPSRIVNSLNMQNVDVFINGSNLWTISKYRNIRELTVGGEPQSRSFSLGVKAIF